MIEFVRGVIKLMWNSSGYYEVDVEFFRGMPIIVMESVLSFEYFKLRA